MLSLFHRDRHVVGRPFKAGFCVVVCSPEDKPEDERTAAECAWLFFQRTAVIRGYFSGTYVNGIDAKHRLSVPASLRETIEARSQTKALVLSPAEHAPCLIGYDISYFARIEARLEAEFAQDFGPGRSQKARALFSMAEQLKYDDTGRIVLTPSLRDAGELGPQALFLGAGDYFELWAPDILLQQQDLDPRLLRAVKAQLAGKSA